MHGQTNTRTAVLIAVFSLDVSVNQDVEAQVFALELEFCTFSVFEVVVVRVVPSVSVPVAEAASLAVSLFQFDEHQVLSLRVGYSAHVECSQEV